MRNQSVNQRSITIEEFRSKLGWKDIQDIQVSTVKDRKVSGTYLCLLYKAKKCIPQRNFAGCSREIC